MYTKQAAGLKILLVDDDDLMRDWIGAVLVDMGHEVVSAADGKEALALFAQHQPELALLDQVMPGMSGFEVARQIRAANSWIPIIFVSAYSGNEEVLEGLHAGGDDYLFKPVNEEVLCAKIKVYQERLRMSQKLVEQNGLLLNYQEQIREEQNVAREFIEQFTSLDKISDPLVRFLLRSADNFSGDLIAVARTPGDCLHVLLADSAGHGLTSALAVIPITQPFYQMTAKGFDVPSIVKELNRGVRNYLPLPRYVAAVVLSVDPVQQVIQVWNGGCPDALLFSPNGGGVAHRFKSKQLPLGVLPANEFDAGVEYFSYNEMQARVFLCSDGATELCMNAGQHIDHAELIKKLGNGSAQQMMDGLLDEYDKVLQGYSPPDDIAVIVLDCPPPDSVKPQLGALRVHPNDATPGSIDSPATTVWQFSSTLSAPQLKHLDVIPFLLNITAQIDGAMSDGIVFLVLSELFNNAFDHGLLKLESTLKNHLDGMDNYFRLRAERIANLEHGQISLTLTKQQYANGLRLEIHVKDSGDGFDHAVLKHGDADLNEKRSGRGIFLLANVCSVLRYEGNGSEVYACLDLPVEQ